MDDCDCGTCLWCCSQPVAMFSGLESFVEPDPISEDAITEYHVCDDYETETAWNVIFKYFE